MKLRPAARPRLLVEELERRILFSADSAALLGFAGTVDGAEVRLLEPVTAAPPAVQPSATAQQSSAREIVFIDSRVPDAMKLADELMAQRGGDRVFDIVILDANEDGVAQIDKILANEHDLAAIHIISHGSDGAIEIGSTALDAAKLAVDGQSVARWGQSLAAGGDLLLYGCDVAQDPSGQAFVQSLARLTGADVAASNDRTGQASLGGNWNLEYRSGNIEAGIALGATAQAQWQGVLANTAPTLSGANNLTAISEYPATNPGTLVSALIAGMTSDVDPSALTGIAVTAVDNSHGNWQYSTDSGTTWLAFGTPSAASSRLLAADASTFVRFVPNTGWSGVVGNGITFRAWDQSVGSAGTNTDTSANGGTTAFSLATASAGITVNATGSITGTVYEDLNGDSNLADAVGVANVTVRLYRDDGSGAPDAGDSLVATTFTSAGSYSFSGLADATYWVVVDSRTITPSAGFNVGFGASDVWAEQTYGAAGSVGFSGGTYTFSAAAGSFFGGMHAGASDAAATLATAEHLTREVTTGSTIAGVNSAFSFNVVTTTRGGDSSDDDGSANRTVQGSLRQFIQNANAISGANAMRFVPTTATNATDGAGNNWWRIDVTNVLQSVTDAGTTLDGMAYSAADGTTVRDTNAGQVGTGGTVGVDGLTLDRVNRPELEIAGSALNAPGITVDAASGTVRNLAIDGFVPNGGGAIYAGAQLRITSAATSAGGGVLVSGDLIGMHADGTNPGVAQVYGININGAATVTNNFIAFVNGNGVMLSDAWMAQPNTQAVTFADNEMAYIGDPAAGTGDMLSDISNGAVIRGNYLHDFIGNQPARPYSGKGIEVWYQTQSALIENNTIANMRTAGIGVNDGSQNNTIRRNIITGTTGDGTNGGAGILITSFNDTATSPPSGNRITENSIYGNAGLGIDIDPGTVEALAYGNGVSANDAGDADTGGNGLQNFPVLSAAATSGSQITITGSLNSSANSYFRIEFFSNVTADGSGHGEGQRYLGFANVTTDGAGNATISTTLNATVAVGEFITATATRSNATFTTFADTSEFAQDVTATAWLTATNMSAAETYTEDIALNLIDIVVGTTSATATATLTLSNAAAGSLNTATSGSVTSTFAAGVWTASGAVANVNTLLSGLTFTPTASLNGNFTIATSVSDGVAAPITGTKVISGTAVNDAPVQVFTGTNFTGIYAYNDASGNWFVQNTPVDTGTIQSKPQGAALHLSDSAGGSSSSGVIVYFDGSLKLGDLLGGGFASTGSALAMNIYLDTGNDGQFFSFSGAQFTGLNGDSYGTVALGANGGAFNDNTVFTKAAGIAALPSTFTLAQLKAGAVPGIDINTRVALWIGGGNAFSSDISNISVAARTAGSLTVQEDSGLTSLGLGDVAFGPGGGADEAGQTLSYTVTAVPNAAAGSVVLADGSTVVTASTGYSLAQIQGMQFRPAANANGAGGTFSFSVQDSGGTLNGGVNSITQSLALSVAAVNDAPVASGSATLAAINEDTASPAGATVSSLFSANFSDSADQVTGGSSANTFAGIAISSYTVDAAKGNWQYSTDTGGSWTTLGSATTSAAITLDAAASTVLRFVPAANYNGAATALSANLIESGQVITNGATTNLTGATGTTTHISSATAALAEAIVAVNDAPTATNLNAAQTYTEDTPLALTAIVAGDVDSASLTATLTLSNAAAGSLNMGTSGAVTSTYNAVSGVWSASGATADVNALLAALTFTPTANFSGNFTIATSVSDGSLAVTGSKAITGTPVNDAPTVTDRALSFDGTDLVVVAPQPSLVMSSTLTIEATVQRTGALSGTQIIVNKEGEYEIGIAADGKLQWAFANTTPGWNWVETSYTVPADTWVQIAVTYNNGVIKTYANGTLADTYNGTGTIGDVYPALNNLTIGGRQNAITQRFTGLIDEVRVWNVERSGAQIQAAYNSTLAGNEAGLVGYWRFSEGSGTTAIDSSTQGNNGVRGDGVATDVPTRTTNLDYTTAEDTPLTVATAGVLTFATDPEGSALAATLVSGPAHAAAFVLNADGSFSYTPSADFNGTDSFVFTASDGSLNSQAATVLLNVTAVNDAPLASGSATLAAINEDTASPAGATVSSLFSANFSDSADQVTGGSSANTFAGIAISSYTVDAAKGNWQYSTDTGGSWTTLGSATTSAAITLDAAASTVLRFVPAANYNGAATALSANLIESGQVVTNGAIVDLTGATGTTTHISAATVALGETINPVADTPSVTNATTNEDTQSTTGLVISRNAADGAEVGFFQITGISNGTLYQNDGTTAIANNSFITYAQGNAGLKFTPAANFNGNGSFTVQASTSNVVGGLGGGTVSATITVNPVNDAPTGSVTLAGTPTQGQTLSVSDNLADADGLGTITYHWYAGAVDTGATGASYVLAEADVGKTFSVHANDTDGHGTAESVTSNSLGPVANVNDAPTGSVTLSGTPTQGQALTVSDNLADADGLGTITYHWYAGAIDTGATGASYVLAEADVGKTFSVRATYTDGHGTAESVTSNSLGPVANVNDAPTGAVTLAGTPTQGQTLSVIDTLADADGLGTITYHWYAGAVDTGATGTSYVLAETDVGKTFSVRATYTDGHGTAESVTSNSLGPVANVNDAPTGAVTLAGTPTQGQTLSVTDTLADADGLGTITYHWYAGAVDTGATGNSYLLAEADVGKTFSVRATYTDGHGTPESVTSNSLGPVANVNDAPTGAVTLAGTSTQGQTLSVTNTLADADGLGTIIYHWYTGAADTGATGASYVLAEADVGKTFSVRATYTDGHGTNESVTSNSLGPVANVNDAPMGSVTLSGTPTQGQTLSVSDNLADADGLGTITYHWYAGAVDTGATGSSYVLTEVDVGKTFSVRATYTDGHGSNESVTSNSLGPVANVNDAPTGSVTLSGTPTQGQTLTVSDNLADADGLGTITYHWYASAVDTGATGTSYVLAEADVGKTFSVHATYTDGHGTNESVASNSLGPVANVNDAPTGSVTLAGTPTQGQTLSVSDNLADADGLGAITYHWYASAVDTGATGASYVLAEADVGKTFSVVTTYTDGHGTNESVTSNSLGPVANVNDAPTGAVTLAGTPTQGQTLSVTDTLADADGLGTITYHWYASAVDTGATGASYVLAEADVGKTFSVVATYTDGHGTNESVTSNSLGPVANVNDAPTTSAVTLTAIVEDSGARIITQAELLANAADVDGPSLAATNLAIGSGAGTLVDNGDGSWTYTPAANDDSSVSFIYNVTDGSLTAAGSATLDITPVNDAPTTSTATLAAVAEDSGARLITQAELLANASDVDGPSLSATGLAITSGAGTLVDNGNGTWTYTPAPNDDSSVSFNYTVTDGSLSAAGSASLDITPVNDAPTTSPVTLAPIAEDSGARLITQAELLANAADIDGPSLSATGLAIRSGSGTLVDNGNGTWSYTPASNDDTAVSFSYTVTDGSLNATGSASLDITPVNDAPTASAVTLAPIAEDSGARVITQAELLANAADVDGPSLAATNLAISNGSGTLVDNGNGTWTYTPAANDDTAVNFSYTVTDGSLTAAGTAALDITPVNDAPVIATATMTLQPSQALVLSSAQLKANDVDSNASALVFDVRNVTAGRFELVASAGVPITQFTQAQVAQGDVRFVYTDVARIPSFDVTAFDGSARSASVSVVASVTAAPTTVPTPPTTPPGESTQVAKPAVEATLAAAPASADTEGPARTPRGDRIVPPGSQDVALALDGTQSVFGPASASPARAEQQARATHSPHELVAKSLFDLDLRIADDAYLTRVAYLPITDLLQSSAQYLRAGSSDAQTQGSTDTESRQEQAATVTVQVAQATGVALSVGAVWWALRAGGLVASLLGTLPMWRHVDLLAVLPDEEEEDDWDADVDDEARRDEKAVGNVFEPAMDGDPR